MGLEQLTSTILTKFKADTSDHVSAIKRLRGEEKAAAQARLSELEAGNKGIESQIAMLGKVALGVGSVIALYKIGQNAAKAYMEDMRLESAAAGANVEKLTQATRGLIEHDKLLEFAGRTMHGTWKLNQEDMEKVLHGAMALRKTMGVELQPTIEKLTEAISKGNTKALREFGIEAKDKMGVLKELDGLYGGLHGNVALAGDKFTASGVALSDAVDDMKGSLGEMVVALAPAIQALADFIGLLSQGIGNLRGFADSLLGVGDETIAEGAGSKEIGKQNAQLRHFAASVKANRFSSGNEYDTFAELYPEFAKELRDGVDPMKVYAEMMRAAKDQGDYMAKLATAEAGRAAVAKMRQGPKFGPAAPAGWGQKSAAGSGGGTFTPSGQFELEGHTVSDVGFRTGAGIGPESDLGSTDITGALRRATADEDYAAAIAGAKDAAEKFKQIHADLVMQARTNVVEQIFGTPAQINATTEAILLAQTATQGLATIAGDAYDTIVSGEGTLGESIKRSTANVLEMMAKQMFIRSIMEAAEAAAYAFVPGMQGVAAGHATAAGIFLAGSAVAHQAANALGGGGQGVSSSAGGGGGGRSAGSYMNATGGGSRRGEDTHNVTVIMGGGALNMTDKERRARLAYDVHRGLQGKSRTVRDG